MASANDNPSTKSPEPPRKLSGILGWIEWAGNKLPDPAMLFVWALLLVWVFSALLSNVEFTEEDPRTRTPLVVRNMLEPSNLVAFLTGMVRTFATFPPLGVVLVALLGVGVAEHVGFINALVKALLRITPGILLTPMFIAVGIISHTAGDTGYVLVIPIGGVIFYAAGRHPLAGILAGFAAVSGGFSANFIVSGLDPLLQSITQASAQVYDSSRTVNPLCNYYFTATSSVLIILLGWIVTDYFIEPRLRRDMPLDGDLTDLPKMEGLTNDEARGLLTGLGTLLGGLFLLMLAALPADSPFRDKQGSLTNHGAPLMDAIVPLIFLLFLFPAIAYGMVAGSVKSHRDVVKGMSKSMSTMGYYIVLAFFAAQFIWVFGQSNLGALLAIKGANLLRSMDVSPAITIVGIIILSGTVNLLIGSASAKWALLGPIFVPMLMSLGYSPELTQAAYRVGDSCTNIITPLMPYFPLVVAFGQRYVKDLGIGTMIARMLPYSLTFLVCWTIYLLIYWQILGWPLGVQAPYTYP